MNSELPRFVRCLLASPPRRGGGLNFWFFKAARVLHPFLPPAEIVNLLAAVTIGEPVKAGEIERAVEKSKAFAWQPGQPAPARQHAAPWPALDAEQRQAIIASGGGLAALRDAAPISLEAGGPHTEAIVDVLFPGNPLLCIGKTSWNFRTAEREELRGTLAAQTLIVPSPMLSRTGLTQDGKESAHCLANTGPRKYLVIEQDAGSMDDQAAILLHLAHRAPLALVVFSGSKSLHGWFPCGDTPEAKLRAFMAHAVCIGADPATWTRSQFVRMPDGTRENGNRQAIVFCNGEVLK